jgi:hypothetical protein
MRFNKSDAYSLCWSDLNLSIRSPWDDFGGIPCGLYERPGEFCALGFPWLLLTLLSTSFNPLLDDIDDVCRKNLLVNDSQMLSLASMYRNPDHLTTPI